MPDIRTILDPLATDKALKAQAWDDFHAAQTPEDFQARFDKLALPKEAKAALWDAKFAAPPDAPAAFVVPGMEKLGGQPPGVPTVRGAAMEYDPEGAIPDKRSALKRAADLVDNPLRMGSRAAWGIVQGAASAVEALGGFLAADTDVPQLDGGLIQKPIGKALKGFAGDVNRLASSAIAGSQPTLPKLDKSFTEDPRLLFDVDYMTGQLGAAAGNIAPFVLLGMGAAAAVDGALAKSAVKASLRPVLSAVGGTAVMSVAETAIDAGANYREAIDKYGFSENVARDLLLETMKREIAPTAILNLAGVMNPLVKGWLKRASLSVLTEGAQEPLQGAAQRSALNAYLPPEQQVSLTEEMPMELLQGVLGGPVGGAMVGDSLPGAQTAGKLAGKVKAAAGRVKTAVAPPAKPQATPPVVPQETQLPVLNGAGEPNPEGQPQNLFDQAADLARQQGRISRTQIAKALGVSQDEAKTIFGQLWEAQVINGLGKAVQVPATEPAPTGPLDLVEPALDAAAPAAESPAPAFQKDPGSVGTRWDEDEEVGQAPQGTPTQREIAPEAPPALTPEEAAAAVDKVFPPEAPKPAKPYNPDRDLRKMDADLHARALQKLAERPAAPFGVTDPLPPTIRGMDPKRLSPADRETLHDFLGTPESERITNREDMPTEPPAKKPNKLQEARDRKNAAAREKSLKKAQEQSAANAAIQAAAPKLLVRVANGRFHVSVRKEGGKDVAMPAKWIEGDEEAGIARAEALGKLHKIDPSFIEVQKPEPWQMTPEEYLDSKGIRAGRQAIQAGREEHSRAVYAALEADQDLALPEAVAKEYPNARANIAARREQAAAREAGKAIGEKYKIGPNANVEWTGEDGKLYQGTVTAAGEYSDGGAYAANKDGKLKIRLHSIDGSLGVSNQYVLVDPAKLTREWSHQTNYSVGDRVEWQTGSPGVKGSKPGTRGGTITAIDREGWLTVDTGDGRTDRQWYANVRRAKESPAPKPDAAAAEAAQRRETSNKVLDGAAERILKQRDVTSRAIAGTPENGGIEIDSLRKMLTPAREYLEKLTDASESQRELLRGAIGEAEKLIAYWEEKQKPAAKPEPGKPASALIPGTDKLIHNVTQALTLRMKQIENNLKFMAQAAKDFGGSIRDGAYTVKDAYDALEAGVNKYILREYAGKTIAPREMFRYLRAILAELPTQAARTKEQEQFQQFSTPPHLAYLVAEVAGIQPGDVVLEPSAGVGGIAVWAKVKGAIVHVNEISDRRAALLGEVGFENVTQVDAEILDDVLPDQVKPTVVVMNPPFSATGGRVSKNDNKFGYRHLTEALKRLQPGGRLVAILGEGARLEAREIRGKMQGSTSQGFFHQLGKTYNIRANVGISGKEYQKYGTTFGTQVIIIDKTGPTLAEPIHGEYDSVEAAYAALENIAGERRSVGDGARQVPGDDRTGPGNGQPGDGKRGAGSGTPQRSETSGRPEPRPGDPAATRGNRPEGTGKPGSARSEPRPDSPPRQLSDQERHQEIQKVLDAQAAQAEKELQDLIRQYGTQLNSGIPLDAVGKFLEVVARRGAAEIHRGYASFKKFTARMKELFPQLVDFIEQHARNLHDRALELYEGIVEGFDKPAEPEPAPPAADQAPGEIETGEAKNKAKDEEGEGEFESYEPAKLRTGEPHKGRIVESKAMASVEPPDIKYTPALPKAVYDSKLRSADEQDRGISALQLESVIYAGQQHSIVREGTRAGFFIGDGTGVGKGREIAAIIYDNHLQGRKRALWVSVSQDLESAAQEDLDDVLSGLEIKNLNKWQMGKPITYDGPVFVTYSTLIKTSTTGKGTRLDQVLGWKPDVIIFDEAHRAKNAIGYDVYDERRADKDDAKQKKGKKKKFGGSSQSGDAVVSLQAKLPDARVVYVSATGATDPRNLGYASRLGLWGRGTAFPGGFRQFLADVESGGVGAMEMIARELKALGRYLSRSLSYKGVEFDEKEHPLSKEQKAGYDKATEAWEVILNNIDRALVATGRGEQDPNTGEFHIDSKARTRAMLRFWGDNQRFYRKLITAMKVPTVIAEAEKALERGNAVIVSLIGTGESQAKDQVKKAVEEGLSYDDLDFSPRQMLEDYLKKAFPIYKMQEVQREDGTTKLEYVKNADGSYVISKEAEALRDKLLKELEAITLPENPLEQLLNYFDGKGVGVAELTGRKNRIVRDPKTGKPIEQKRVDDVAMDRQNKEEMRRFMEGEALVAVISQAASTGISLHASNKAKNKRRRTHIVMELSWSADTQMQIFGRSHRSNQAQPPEYILISTDIGGEKRFSSTIARRLASLGALTKGERKAGGGSDVLAKYNFESKYGITAVEMFFRAISGDPIAAQQLPPRIRELGVDGFRKKLDAARPKGEGTKVVTHLLNRVLNLPIDLQNEAFGMFARMFDSVVETAKTEGSFDDGTQDIRARDVKVLSEEVLRRDTESGAPTIHYELDATVPVQGKQEQEAVWYIHDFERQTGYFYRHRETGKMLVARPGQDHTDAKTGAMIPWVNTMDVREYGGMPVSKLERDYEQLPNSEGRRDWAAEYEGLPKEEVQRLHILGGSVLPIWKQLRDAKSGIKIVRVTAANGERVVGVRVGPKILGSLKRNTNAESLAEELFDRVFNSGENVTLSGGVQLSKRFYSGNGIFAISTYNEGSQDALEQMGLQSFKLGSQTFYYLTGEYGDGTMPDATRAQLTEVLKAFPPAVQEEADTGDVEDVERRGTAKQDDEPLGGPSRREKLKQRADAMDWEDVTTPAQMRGRDGKPHEYEAVGIAVQGLMVQRTVESKMSGDVEVFEQTGTEWNVTHQRSGLIVGGPYKTKAEAKVYAMRLLEEGDGFDWERSADEIKDDPQLKALAPRFGELRQNPYAELKAGKSVAYALRQTPLDPDAPGDQLGREADAEYRDEHKHVALNWQARGIIESILLRLGQPARQWEAVTIGLGRADDLAATLESSPGLGPTATKLTGEIRKAIQSGLPLILVEESAHLENQTEVLREELFHRAQYIAGGGDVMIELSEPSAARLALDPIGSRIVRWLTANTKTSRDEWQYEIPAHAARGPAFWAEAGISAAEARKVLDLYFSLIEREHGKEVADALRKAAPAISDGSQQRPDDSLQRQQEAAHSEGSRATRAAGERGPGEQGQAGEGADAQKDGVIPSNPEAGFITADFLAPVGEGLRAAGELLKPTLGRIRGQGRGGAKLARLIERATDAGEVAAGQRVARLEDQQLRKLTRAQRFELLDVLEGRVRAAAGHVAAAAAEIRALFDEIAAEATGRNLLVRVNQTLRPGDPIPPGVTLTPAQQAKLAQGHGVRISYRRPFAKRGDYFPHVIPHHERIHGQLRADIVENLVRLGIVADAGAANVFLDSYLRYMRSGKREKRLLQYLVDSGQARSEADALAKLMRHRLGQQRSGSLEYSREINLPFWDPDPVRVLPQAIARQSIRLKHIAAFGQDNQVIKRLLNAIRREGANYELAKKAADQIVGYINDPDDAGARLGRLVRAWQGLKLGLASIANSLQGPLNTWLAADLRAVAAGFAGVASKSGRRFGVESGATLESVINESLRHAGASGEALSTFLRATGFTATERANRIFAANAGASYATRMYRRAVLGDKRAGAALAELGLDATAIRLRGGLSREDVLQAAKKFSDLTQFRSRPQDLPMFANSEIGKVFFQFKNYIYGQTRLIGREVALDFRTRSYGRATRDLFLLAGVFPVTGMVVRAIRNLITGRDDEDKDWLDLWLSGIAALGAAGFLGDLIEASKYPGGVLEWAVGPSISEGAKIADLITNPTWRKALKRVPFLGQILAERLTPARRGGRGGVADPEMRRMLREERRLLAS